MLLYVSGSNSKLIFDLHSLKLIFWINVMPNVMYTYENKSQSPCYLILLKSHKEIHNLTTIVRLIES